MDIKEQIEKRMASGESFTFAQLWTSFSGDSAYRIADKAIQSWRRKGWISFERVGRNCVWSLTDKGREALRPKATE